MPHRGIDETLLSVSPQPLGQNLSFGVAEGKIRVEGRMLGFIGQVWKQLCTKIETRITGGEECPLLRSRHQALNFQIGREAAITARKSCKCGVRSGTDGAATALVPV